MEQAVAGIMEARLVILLAALLVNALLMGPPWLMGALLLDRPGRLLTRLLRLLERKLNREKRLASERKKRGLALCLAMLGLAGFAGLAVASLSQFSYWGTGLEIFFAAWLISLRPATDLCLRTANLLEGKQVSAVRDILTDAGWRTAPLLDAHGQARAPVEIFAVRWVEGVMAPVLWYLLLGLPGMAMARMTGLLLDTVGQHRESFGWAATRIADAVFLIPGWLGGAVLVCASCCLPFASPYPAFRALVDGTLFAAVRLQALAVVGSALFLALGGPLSPYTERWLGGTIARAVPQDTRRAAWLGWTAALLLWLFLALCWWW